MGQLSWTITTKENFMCFKKILKNMFKDFFNFQKYVFKKNVKVTESFRIMIDKIL